tara:strand:+ start:1631 stop:1864 length:234 start_codon:yes stop_codon:yes gene_type:complete
MLWKLRQEDMSEQDDPMDDVTAIGRLSGWIEKPHLSKEELLMRDIAEMQSQNHKLMIRVKELGEEINRLKEKLNADL